MFKIIRGTLTGGELKFTRKNLVLTKGRKKFQIPWEDVEQIQLVDAQAVSKSDSATFGVIGALAGGPLGAAVGASVGRLSRPCTFYVKSKGREFVAEGYRMLFDKLHKEFEMRRLIS